MGLTTDTDKDGVQDATILAPEREAVIAGVPVVMREYTFAETLRHGAMITALTDAMADIAMAGKFSDLDSLRSAFGENGDILLRLIAVASDQPLAWVQGVCGIEADTLFMLWWEVNADFFLRRVLLSVQLRKVREHAGLTSSPPSLLPGSAPPGSLPGTPTVN